MKTRRSWRNQDRLWKALGGQPKPKLKGGIKTLNGKETGVLDLEHWFNKYKQFWTKEEADEFEREIMVDWRKRHERDL